MHIESFRDLCLSKPGTTEEMPFGNDTLVFKVLSKIYALTDINEFSRISLKCDPERAVRLREQYDSVIPGYHLNKKHWNTILIDGHLSDPQLVELIDHSYDLVRASLPAGKKEQLKNMT